MHQSPPLTKRELAAGLGVDPALVTRDAARGMPTHSIEAARRWRDLHIRPYSRIPMGQSIASDREDADQRRLELLAVTDGSDMVRAVRALGLVAADLARAGRFETVRDPLRALLAAIPAQLRPQVALPGRVWRALTAHVARLLHGQAPEGPHDADDRLVSIAAGPDGPDDFGARLYAIAAGELGLGGAEPT